MQTLPVDSAWLVDSFELLQFYRENEFGGVEYKDPVTVSGCRIDYKPTYTRTAEELTKLGDAVIYCYAAFTKGAALSDMVEKSKVMIRGKTYTVKQARQYHGVTDSEPYSAELVIL